MRSYFLIGIELCSLSPHTDSCGFVFFVSKTRVLFDQLYQTALIVQDSFRVSLLKGDYILRIKAFMSIRYITTLVLCVVLLKCGKKVIFTYKLFLYS